MEQESIQSLKTHTLNDHKFRLNFHIPLWYPFSADFSVWKIFMAILFIALPYLSFGAGMYVERTTHYIAITACYEKHGTWKQDTAMCLARESTGSSEVQATIVPKNVSEAQATIAPENVVDSSTPLTTAHAYTAVNLTDATVLERHNSSTPYPIASITKLVTALVVLEKMDLYATTTVPEEALVHTSKARLEVGQTIPIYELLYLLLTESSNEAAITLAYDFGYDDFVKEMNTKVQSLHMQHTVLVDPTGSGGGNISTAEDLVRLAQHLVEKNQYLLALTASRFYDTSPYPKPSIPNLGNYNFFSLVPTFVGGKTGQTTAAKETMLAIFNIENESGVSQPTALIVLGTEDSKGAIELLRSIVIDSAAE